MGNNPEFIGLPIGGLEQNPGNRPSMNIFVGLKVPWHEITDGLPQYHEWPPGGSDAVRAVKNSRYLKDHYKMLKEICRLVGGVLVCFADDV